ncbi:carbohydrate kinase family protein [Luteococcus sp. Sow4_B9]|uniref:carbohydrate kinase family protein n=1 Tax=Luteococcus sp. Sow4_B9 TaxID=3438792 RepID=UPI003F9BE8A6
MESTQNPSPRTLCVGEALVDVVMRDGVTTGEHVGGSPLNVACVMAQLGHDATIGAWWGDDERGAAIEAHAAAHHVAVQPGSNRADKTSVAYAHLDAQGRADYEFDLEWALPDMSDVASYSHLHTGSIAATLEPGGSQVVAAVRAVRGQGTVSYDPNIRPALMGEPATVVRRIEELVALSDVVKASDEDLAWLYPGTAVEDILLRWSTLGPALVVVTRGPQGAWARLAGNRDVLQVAPLTVELVDTVGAGDSFMGGLLSGLLDAGLLGSREAAERLAGAGWGQVQPALHRAVTTSGLTVSRAGAHAPTRDEVQTVMAADPGLAG